MKGVFRLGAIVLVLFAVREIAIARTRSGELREITATATTPNIPIYVARPESGVALHAGIVVLPGCEGFDGFYASQADRLATHGYLVVALASKTKRCSDRSGSRDEAVAARAVLTWLGDRRDVPKRLGVLGFSMGAIAVLDLVDPASGESPPPGLDAAVAYYPKCRASRASIRVPLAIFDGSADAVTPAAPCASLVRTARARGADVTITTYPGATHAFAVPVPAHTFRGEPVRFDPHAAASAATADVAFFTLHLARARHVSVTKRVLQQ